LYCVKFFIKKAIRKKVKSTITSDEAHKIIEEVYQKPGSNPEYINPEIDENLDLSIIVTVYNYEDKLRRNIESCISQKTKYKFEVIFVNDGSTDSSKNIIEQYVDNDKVKLINKENGGAASARNVGINVSSGKYIMFVDCDDVLHENIVEELMEAVYKDNLDLAMCAYNLITVEGQNIISNVSYIYPSKNLFSYNNCGLLMNYPGFPWGKVFKREMFDDVRFPEGCWYEDTIIIMLLYTKCKSYKYVEKPLYDYYIHEKNITHTVSNSKSLKSIDRYWVLNEISKYYDIVGLKTDSKIYELMLRHASLYYYKDIKLLDKKIVEALFVLAKELVFKYKPKSYRRLSYSLRQVEKSFQKNDISLWKLASSYQ
jgi:glycosyltransferase involved in cell wall biosynthesis